MRVFISGVAGFLGSHLADALLARGDSVVGVDSLIGGYVDNVPKGVDFYVGDCNDLPKVKKAMRACDVVYHMGCTAHEGLSVFSPHENVHNGYSATSAMISAAISNNVKRFIFTSSMARYGTQPTTPFTEDMVPQPQDPYGIGKWASELLLQNLANTHGMEWVIAVPHNIYGPRQKYDDPFRNVASIMINLMLQGRQPYIYGDGSQQRCFSYYTDDIEPLMLMSSQDNVVGEVINIGPDNEVITIYDLCKMIAKLLNFELDAKFSKPRPQEVHIAHCSADKARKLLNYDPKIGLEEGLLEMIKWIKARGVRPFSYHSLDIEIENDKLPDTWNKRLF